MGRGSISMTWIDRLWFPEMCQVRCIEMPNTNAAIPERVCVRVSPPPPAGLAVSLCFQMARKNDFHFLLLLDEGDTACVTKDELLQWFDQERSTFIMDYGDPRIAFTGRITARVLGSNELKQALETFELYRKYLWYPEQYGANLARAIRLETNSSDFRVEVLV